MQRLAAFHPMEDTVGRGDKDDGLTAVFQPDQVVVTFGGNTIEGIVGPIKVAHNVTSAHHVYCMTSIDSRRLKAIFENGTPAVTPESRSLGDHALVIINVSKFCDRIKAAANHGQHSSEAAPVMGKALERKQALFPRPPARAA